ncbi:MAG TPA: AAA-like domain-containing protein [Thermotogota bacterium]|nr:AAA-like domain-containing protein [Thermotogota bacterium]
MERFFNTAGPVDCKRHYCLDPLQRMNLQEVLELIDQWKYFVVHAPRQTGKTSSLKALQGFLNTQGHYKCLYVNMEAAQAAREKVPLAMQSILYEMAQREKFHLGETFFQQNFREILASAGAFNALNGALSAWTLQSAQPTVLLVDEVDSLVGDTLISVLRQLRSGYDRRPGDFPQSVILCGVRDVRDYRIYSDAEKQVITGGSAFNIKSESLRLGDFTREDIRELYAQHTQQTGQRFEEGVFKLVWEYTEGQPWLVNALAYQACFRDFEGKDRNNPVTPEMMERAKNELILRRDTHLDQLADKLNEKRVQRVIEPLLKGELSEGNVPADDIEYCETLGLIKTTGNIHIANAIYREIIPRTLTYSKQKTIVQEPAWYIQPDGLLNMDKLLTAFQQFFREHSESWLERFQYREAGPQLLLQAFLQRIINGGGHIDREYGLGRMRTDLYIRWPQNGVQRIVIECKLKHGYALETLIQKGLEQTAEYQDKTGAQQAHLVIFDQDNVSWEEKVFKQTREYHGKNITVWGM